MDTIFALASAPGKAGVAVVRVSGSAAFAAAQEICGSLPEARSRGLRDLRDASGAVIDRALVLCFAEGKSFTGEDIVEFHLHGSTAIISAVLNLLGGFDGLRHAQAGEFTRRALENGRLDLAQVEGLADLIDAETEAQRRQAMRVLAGDLGDKAEKWRQHLVRAAALLEASIDFADEDVPVDVTPEVVALLRGVIASLIRESAGVIAAERIRQGFEVAIVGAPNVGKSTLLNALAGRDAAITSEHAGTTRDVIEVRMDIGGLPVTLLDTAGLRETEDDVEAIGIERALERAAEADLRIFLMDGEGEIALAASRADIVLVAKSDDGSAVDGISGKTGAGIPQLMERLEAILSKRMQNVGVATRERHRRAMMDGITALNSAVGQLSQGSDSLELAAEDVRAAIRALDALVGRIDVENLLDEIFASFCIGK